MLYPISELGPGSQENLYGYIDSKGKVVIHLSYSGVGHFFEGTASVLNSAGKSGFIDGHGNLLIGYKHRAAFSRCQPVFRRPSIRHARW